MMNTLCSKRKYSLVVTNICLHTVKTCGSLQSRLSVSEREVIILWVVQSALGYAEPFYPEILCLLGISNFFDRLDNWMEATIWTELWQLMTTQSLLLITRNF